MSDIGAAIQEVMESYEVEIDGKVFPVKAIRNITGHDILRYHIHGGKQIPFIKNNNQDKMEEGEVYAIETFGSTGRGFLDDDVGHKRTFPLQYTYLINAAVGWSLRLREKREHVWCQSASFLGQVSPQNHRRQFWQHRLFSPVSRASWGEELSSWGKLLRERCVYVIDFTAQMKNLVDNGIVECYSPLVDVKGSYTAQFEHTILLHSGGKEVISRGDDY